MLIMTFVLIIAGITAAMFWVIEIDYFFRQSRMIINDKKGGNIIKLPKLILALVPFTADVTITMAMTSVFIISISIPGTAISLLMSDVISIYILTQLKKTKLEVK